MFTHQIIAILGDGIEVKLPLDIKLIPYWFSSIGYIPPYVAEGEEYGGYEDYDEYIVYEDENDRIIEYLTKNYNYDDETDNFTLYYEVEKALSEYDLSLNDFVDRDHFNEFISDLIDCYSLSDNEIDQILRDKDFLFALLKNTKTDFIIHSTSEELNEHINVLKRKVHSDSLIINTKNIGNRWVAVINYDKKEK